MKTLKDVPEKARKHFDAYDMIGTFHPAGDKDELGNVIGEQGWVDGGDSCHFVGLYYYAYALDSKLKHRSEYYGNMIGRLYAAAGNLQSHTFFGGFKRHPDAKYWYSDDNRMSRDQATPMLAALGLGGALEPLRAQFKQFLRRGLLFATNTRRNGTTASNDGVEYYPGKRYDYGWKLPDLMLFDIWAIYIRSFNWWALYPVLLLADLQTLINCLILLRNEQDTDVANFFVKHSLSRKKLPTFIGAITQKLLPRLNLPSRIAIRYAFPRNPQFLGNILREAAQNFEKNK